MAGSQRLLGIHLSEKVKDILVEETEAKARSEGAGHVWARTSRCRRWGITCKGRWPLFTEALEYQVRWLI